MGLIVWFERRQIVLNINEVRVVNFRLLRETNGRQKHGTRGRGYEFYEFWHYGLLLLLVCIRHVLDSIHRLEHDASVVMLVTARAANANLDSSVMACYK